MSTLTANQTIYRALMTVTGLLPGKTSAPEREPVPQVKLEHVLKTIEYCHKTVADMIRVQLLSGMRPKEVRVKAGIPHWSPNQLRHATATANRDKYGLDYAQAVLGHASANTTEIYAKVSFEKAAGVMREIG